METADGTVASSIDRHIRGEYIIIMGAFNQGVGQVYFKTLHTFASLYTAIVM